MGLETRAPDRRLLDKLSGDGPVQTVEGKRALVATESVRKSKSRLELPGEAEWRERRECSRPVEKEGRDWAGAGSWGIRAGW